MGLTGGKGCYEYIGFGPLYCILIPIFLYGNSITSALKMRMSDISIVVSFK